MPSKQVKQTGQTQEPKVTYNRERANGKKWSRHHSTLLIHPGHNMTGRTKPSGHSIAGYSLATLGDRDPVIFALEQRQMRYDKRKARALARAKKRSEARAPRTRKFAK